MIKYTKVAVLGANSPEWFSCAVGAVMAGGLVRVTIVYVKPLTIVFHHMYDEVDQVTGVYTTNTTEAVHYQLKHSMTNIAVVDGRAQLEKVHVDEMIDNHDHVDDYDLMVMMMSLRC